MNNPLTPRRLGRLAAVATGLVTAGALSLSGPASAAPAHYTAGQLAAVNTAVDRSGVDGISWYVDAAANRVVVNAFDTTTAADVATPSPGIATTPPHGRHNRCRHRHDPHGRSPQPPRRSSRT